MAYKIVKEIDRLGRIVLPKSIRQHLKVKSGDSIFFELQEERVLIGKFNEVLHISDYAELICETMFEMTSHACIITDLEKVIAVSGMAKNLIGNNIVFQVEDIICDNKKLQIKEYIKADIMCEQKKVGYIVIVAKEKVEKNIKPTVEIISRYIGKLISG